MSDRNEGKLDLELLRPSGALLAANIALGAAIDRCAVSDVGYDATTLDLLVRLDIAPDAGLRAVELCRQLQLSPSHVSRMIDRAEEAGLVRRNPDPADRRASLIQLTGDGRDVVGAFAPRLHGVLDRVVFETLAPKEIDVLVALLERVEVAASAAMAVDRRE